MAATADRKRQYLSIDVVFSATVMHVTTIQHDGQDVAGQDFENVNICKLILGAPIKIDML